MSDNANFDNRGRPSLVHSIAVDEIRQYDLVELRGGVDMLSPAMLVASVDSQMAMCLWFDEHANLQREAMPLGLLIKREKLEEAPPSVTIDMSQIDKHLYMDAVKETLNEALAWFTRDRVDLVIPSWVPKAKSILDMMP